MKRANPILIIVISLLLNALQVSASGGAEPLSSSAISPKIQALLKSITTPQQAIDEAREYQQKGQFGLARLILNHGIELAMNAGESTDVLMNELEYELPVLQAKELLVFGHPDEAEKILGELEKKYQHDQLRGGEVSALLRAIPNSRKLASVKKSNEDAVTANVRERMSEFYREKGHFPPSYRDLNQLIPPGDPVLENFEIVFFRSVPNAYLIVLRNLYDKESLIRIEATGLLR